MNILKQLLFFFYFITLTLFVYLNKGVAYTYFVEILWLLGIISIIYIRKQYRILLSIRIKILIFFIFLSFVYLILALGKYSFTKILQDAFIFFYPIFIFIIFMFKEEIDYIWKILFNIYKIE